LHREPLERCSEHIAWLDLSSEFVNTPWLRVNLIAVTVFLIEHEENTQLSTGVVCKHELGLERDDSLGALALDVDDYVDLVCDVHEFIVSIMICTSIQKFRFPILIGLTRVILQLVCGETEHSVVVNRYVSNLSEAIHFHIHEIEVVLDLLRIRIFSPIERPLVD